MPTFTRHTVESAPEGSKPTLAAIKKQLGFVPNLMATMSESPVLVESYATLMALFGKTDLSETERQIILMTNNRLKRLHVLHGGPHSRLQDGKSR